MDSFGTKTGAPAWIRPLGWRSVLCCALLVVGLSLLMREVLVQLDQGSVHMRAALIGGATAAAATAAGTLPVLMSQQFSQRTYDCFLGFGAGVMLAATSFSLILPALAAAAAAGTGKLAASALVGTGILAGAGLLLLLDRLVSADPAQLAPLSAVDATDATDATNATNATNAANSANAANSSAANPGTSATGNPGGALRRAWLFVAAVALHNLPEGLAIGVAYAGPALDKAHTLATGISIQDVPEGLVVALALRSVGYGRLASVGFGIASGVIEPVAAVFGVALIGVAAGLLPVGLAAAAGAMLFVIVNDVVPESHRHGHGMYASAALVVGFIVMTILDTALG
jgi:ZIP family zinc transporter